MRSLHRQLAHLLEVAVRTRAFAGTGREDRDGRAAQNVEELQKGLRGRPAGILLGSLAGSSRLSQLLGHERQAAGARV